MQPVVCQTNWSFRGKLYGKDRSSLEFPRAKRGVFVSSATEVAHKGTRSNEEKEHELLCTGVMSPSLALLWLHVSCRIDASC